jgi:hypothetical protein
VEAREEIEAGRLLLESGLAEHNAEHHKEKTCENNITDCAGFAVVGSASDVAL